jgi:hypothetical protein
MKTWRLFLLSGLLAAGITPALAAPDFLGQSGNLVTPDDLTVRQGEFSSGYRFLDKSLFGADQSTRIYSANYGFTPRLEAGVAYLNRDISRLLVNAKYQLVSERSGRPSFSVGVVDAFNELHKDPGAYFLLGKSLTRLSGDVRQETGGHALRAYLGGGGGPYSGVIAGLNYTASPRLALMAEYAPKGPLTGRRDAVNLGARFALNDQVRLEAGLFDFNSIGLGVSFSSGLRSRQF